MENQAPPLIISLLEDVHRLHNHYKVGPTVVKGLLHTDFIVGVYTSVGDHLGRKKGYARLYRVAWKLLVSCVTKGDYETLDTIYTIYREMFVGEDQSWVDGEELFHNAAKNVSPWHLKAVVYCWAYLKDSVELGRGGATQDEALLTPERRRTKEDAMPLLRALARAGCFLNMNPEEAEAKLRYQLKHDISARHQRPYLMRPSTSVPGLVTLTLVTVLSKRMLHIRLSPEDLPGYTDSEDLYASIAMRTAERGKREGWYTPIMLMDIMKSQEPVLTGEQRNRWLQVLMGHTEGVQYGAIALILRRTFWEKVSTYQMAPVTREEKVGLTLSYAHSYETLEHSQCFSCEKPPSIQEPLDSRIYCSSGCYEKDFVKFY